MTATAYIWVALLVLLTTGTRVAADEQHALRFASVDFEAQLRGDVQEEDVQMLQIVAQLDSKKARQETVESQLMGTSLNEGHSFLALVSAGGALALGIIVIYWPMGPFVICRILIYLFSLASIKVSVKMVFQAGFAHPRMLSSLHMLASSAVGFGMLFYRRMSTGEPMIVPTMSELLKIVPLALSFAYSLGANNEALLHVSVAFAEMIAGATPLTSAIIVLLLGLPFSIQLAPPMLLVVLGACGTVKGEMSFSLIGLLLCLSSNFFRSAKGALQQAVMTGATKDKYDPITLLAWQCMLAFVALYVWSAFTEGPAPYTSLQRSANWVTLLSILLLSCFNAIVLNFFAIYVVKDLGAVGATIAAQTKSVLVILAGVSVLGEVVTFVQLCGYVAVVVGAIWYSRAEKSLSAPSDTTPSNPTVTGKAK